MRCAAIMSRATISIATGPISPLTEKTATPIIEDGTAPTDPATRAGNGGANAADSGQGRQRDEHNASSKGQLHPRCRPPRCHPHTGEQRRRKDDDRNDEGHLLHTHEGEGLRQRRAHLGDGDVTQAQGASLAGHLRAPVHVINLDRGLERAMQRLEQGRRRPRAPWRRTRREIRAGARPR